MGSGFAQGGETYWHDWIRWAHSCARICCSRKVYASLESTGVWDLTFWSFFDSFNFVWLVLAEVGREMLVSSKFFVIRLRQRNVPKMF